MVVFAESPPIWPAIWSALAATCSCVAALVLMRIHLLNRRDSVRPEIVFDGWSFEAESSGAGIIRFTKVKNLGKGPALHMFALMKIPGATPLERGGPFHAFFIEPMSFLSAASEVPVDWHAYFRWVGSSIAGCDLVPLHLTLVVSDLHGRRHETTYELAASRGRGLGGNVTCLADGLYCIRRITTVTPSWRMRFGSHGARIASVVNQMRSEIDVTRIPLGIRAGLEKHEWWQQLTQGRKA
jgi:hypothetical protein